MSAHIMIPILKPLILKEHGLWIDNNLCMSIMNFNYELSRHKCRSYVFPATKYLVSEQSP